MGERSSDKTLAQRRQRPYEVQFGPNTPASKGKRGPFAPLTEHTSEHYALTKLW